VVRDLQAEVLQSANPAGKGLAQMGDYNRRHARIVASPAGFFNPEDFNLWLALGVGLMIIGIFAFGSPVDREAIDAHV